MQELHTALSENAIRCMELLHRVLGVWLLLCLVAAYVPSVSGNAELKLPFADVKVPVNSAKWTLAFTIFFVGIAASAILRRLRHICLALGDSERLAVVLTYPSVATLGTRRLRALFGYGLAFVQYAVGYELVAPMPQFLGGSPDIGLSFIYAGSAFFFTWELQDWQKGIQVPSKEAGHGGEHDA
jgi:hypothetical protein